MTPNALPDRRPEPALAGVHPQARRLGRAAVASLHATGGVNTHRGAIFGLGLLTAAAAALQEGGLPRPRGEVVCGGGPAGLAYAQTRARDFLADAGAYARDWRPRLEALGRAFVARRLSPGGSADLLACAWFLIRVESP